MDFIARVKSKYPHLTDNDASAIVDKAKMFYYGAMFPCEPNVSEETRPIESFFEKQWIISACDELVERLGFNSATAYRENGVSWTFGDAEISERLMSVIKPTIGVIL